MIAVERAREIVLEAAAARPFETAGLEEAAGRILQESVRADRDLPEWDKALMDGYAASAGGLAAPGALLTVEATIAAGTDPRSLRALRDGVARIMTGAPLPPGADAVVPVEETDPQGPEASTADTITFRSRPAPGDHVAPRGAEVRAGDPLLQPGTFVGAAEVGVLAACGRTRVAVGARPRVAVLATGDEIVPPDTAPSPGRLRNSNGPTLLALAARTGARTRDLGIAPDDERGLERAVAPGLDSDVLVLSGGVSMGVYDLVGRVLRRLGVEILFERVAIKPGKPFTFGRRGDTLVFGCPGNPLSSFVVFEVFVRPALRRLAGHPRPERATVEAVLEEPLTLRAGRTGYHPARAVFAPDGLRARVIRSSGSADFMAAARGNAFVVTGPDVTFLPAGARVAALLLDDADER
jgi:molybdopterin molybdotransferase